MKVASIDDLKREAEEIQKFVDITLSDDGDEAVFAGNTLVVYMSRTAKMLADAKYHLNEKKKSDIMQSLDDIDKLYPFTPKSAVTELIKSLCKEEQHLVDWIERLNAATTHKVDWCRTIISKSKAEIPFRSMHST